MGPVSPSFQRQSARTFTVTNLGGFGVEGFTPVINLPQVAILAVGAIRRVLAFDSKTTIVASHQTVLSLTFDHSFVEGALAAQFLNHVIVALTTPPAASG